MKFSLYMFNPDKVNNFNSLLIADHGYSLIGSGQNGIGYLKEYPDFNYQVFQNIQIEKTPTWLNFINQTIDGSKLILKNKSSSLILLIKILIENRDIFFAITFGSGFHKINKQNIIYDFGLKTALNSIPYEAISVVDGKKLGSNIKETRSVFSKSTNFNYFGLNEYEELLTYIEGKTIDQSLGTKISGKESLGFNIKLSDFKFENIGEQCKKYYLKYNEETYKEYFDFIDNYAIENDNSVIEFLNEKLVETIVANNYDKISISLSNMIDTLNIDSFNFKLLDYSFNELNEDDVFNKIVDYFNSNQDENGLLNLLKNEKVVGSDGDLNKTEIFKLYELINFEIEEEGQYYVLNNGKWYLISEGFVNNITFAINDLDYLIPDEQGDYSNGVNYIKFSGDLSGDIKLENHISINSKGNKQKSEGAYNNHLAQIIGGKIFDKNNFNDLPGYSKVEICDILKDNFFYHIKRGFKSATLSHLFNQAMVSLELFKKEPSYLDKINEISDYNLNSNDKITVVLGIIGNRDIKKSIPFFSKVTLYNIYKSIKSMNADLKILQILEN